MRSISRELFFGLALGALVFACALSWGSPFVTASSGPAVQEPQQAPPPQPPPEAQSSKSTFTGTIVREGEQFMLRDSSGQVYKLDNSEQAKSYEGKAVKVTGEIDANDAKLIHVETIEGASA